MIEVFLDISSLSTMYTIYCSFLLSSLIIFILFQKTNSSLFYSYALKSGFPKPIFLITHSELLFYINPITVWFIKVVKKLRFSDDGKENSNSSYSFVVKKQKLGGSRVETYKKFIFNIGFIWKSIISSGVSTS